LKCFSISASLILFTLSQRSTLCLCAAPLHCHARLPTAQALDAAPLVTIQALGVSMNQGSKFSRMRDAMWWLYLQRSLLEHQPLSQPSSRQQVVQGEVLHQRRLQLHTQDTEQGRWQSPGKSKGQ
jgi:hypothetical protein